MYDFQTRPVFLYGTLMAAPLLALLLTGNREDQDMIVPLRKKAILQHYHHGSVLGKDYPALVKGAENDLLEGLVSTQGIWTIGGNSTTSKVNSTQLNL